MNSQLALTLSKFTVCTYENKGEEGSKLYLIFHLTEAGGTTKVFGTTEPCDVPKDIWRTLRDGKDVLVQVTCTKGKIINIKSKDGQVRISRGDRVWRFPFSKCVNSFEHIFNQVEPLYS